MLVQGYGTVSKVYMNGHGILHSAVLGGRSDHDIHTLWFTCVLIKHCLL